MSEAKAGLPITDGDSFKAGKDGFGFMDHFSKFSGLAVAQLYLLCAIVTGFEVISRYVFNAPTQWAFEVVMVLCAIAWMISAGYITSHKRHISITVFYIIASERTKWWLDLFAMLVGIIALWLLVDDTTVRALESVLMTERAGSAWNSPQPLILKSALAIGGAIYLFQLIVNLYRHFETRLAQQIVLAIGIVILVRVISVFFEHLLGSGGLFTSINGIYSSVFAPLDPSSFLNMRDMDIAAASLLIVALMITLMMTGMPLGVVTLFVSILSALAYFGYGGLYLVSTNAFGLLEKYPLVAVPLFVLMASILERAGVAEDLFDAMSIFAGKFRGGVAIQTIAVAVVLAAMSGVMGGEIVMLGLVALPQLLRLGYDRKMSIGVICASGALATLIPPSIIMIIYGLSAQVAIGDLFMAGAVPGLMLATLYGIYVLVRVNLNPALAPTAEEVAKARGSDKVEMSKDKFYAVMLSIFLIFCVMGSIYAGIASVTEAAAVGVLGAIFVAFFRNSFNWHLLQQALAGTMSTVGTIIWLILGAVAFVGIYNLIGGADFMRSLFSGLGLPALGIVFVMMAILVVLGTFMEWIAIAFITVPVFAPVIVQMAPELGLEPEWAAVWFGVLFVMNIQIYFLSPPFGPACFWLKSVAPADIELQEIFMAVLPFIALQIIGMLLVMFVPDIALWLPKTLN